MVIGLNAGAHPFSAWENYESIGGTSNSAFKSRLKAEEREREKERGLLNSDKVLTIK